MSARVGWILLLVAGMAMVFAGVVLVLLRVIPSPHKQMDYLVIGTLATFASLAALFLVLVTTWVRHPDLFFRRKGN